MLKIDQKIKEKSLNLKIDQKIREKSKNFKKLTDWQSTNFAMESFEHLYLPHFANDHASSLLSRVDHVTCSAIVVEADILLLLVTAGCEC